jgi:hypothetical protein
MSTATKGKWQQPKAWDNVLAEAFRYSAMTLNTAFLHLGLFDLKLQQKINNMFIYSFLKIRNKKRYFLNRDNINSSSSSTVTPVIKGIC